MVVEFGSTKPEKQGIDTPAIGMQSVRTWQNRTTGERTLSAQALLAQPVAVLRLRLLLLLELPTAQPTAAAAQAAAVHRADLPVRAAEPQRWRAPAGGAC